MPFYKTLKTKTKMNLRLIFDAHTKERHCLKPLTTGDQSVAIQYFTGIEKPLRCSQ